MVNENASLVKYEPPKCGECGRKIVVLSDLCAKCAAGIELNGEKQASRRGSNPLPTCPKPPAPPNPPPAQPVQPVEPVAWAETDEHGEIAWGEEGCFSNDPAWIENPIPLYTAPPAAAINEQLLEALEELTSTFEMFVQGMTVPEKSVVGRNIASAKAAIVAAETQIKEQPK